MTRISVERLVNGSTGDPALYLDFPGPGNAVLFDSGDLAGLHRREINDVGVLLLSHHHIDHLMDFSRLIRANIDQDRTLQVIGPAGTIERLEHALNGVAHMRFPFMRLVLEITEVHPDSARWPRARFACQRGFEREALEPMRARRRGAVLDLRECRVRVAPASHTVPCLSYAVEVKRGWRFDRLKAADGVLRPGRWVQRVLDELVRPKAERAERVGVAGAEFEVEALVRDYFTRVPAVKIGFVTDCRADPAVWDGLVELVRGVDRLYCDCYYAQAQAKGAERHGHMTAPQAAQLASEAGVRELWLIHLGPRYKGRYPEVVREAQAVFPHTFADLHWKDDDDARDAEQPRA